MIFSSRRLRFAFFCGMFASTSALADNAEVENALRSRADLSNFYQALVNAGVNHELKPGTHYTIFAPSNAAFKDISPARYPCFYRPECSQQTAVILRNHIIPGTVYLDDVVKQRGGVYSIGQRFVEAGRPNRNNVAVAGNNIIYTSAISGGRLYVIDGIIANRRELAMLQYPNDTAIEADKTVTTTKTRTIADPACGPAGCPDAVTQTITTTRTVAAPH